jgi:hypothetical protein
MRQSVIRVYQVRYLSLRLYLMEQISSCTSVLSHYPIMVLVDLPTYFDLVKSKRLYYILSESKSNIV